ncbi:MAG: hypothetical protein FJ100_08035 [Deltaproteobacteria bacterium]|nr:hypothetical protein [Deltaproteobacteria bacterium]
MGLGTGLSTAGALLGLAEGDAIAVGTAVAGGVDQGYVQRIDPWGHISCPALGACAQVAATGCDDGKPCTAGRCEGATGCLQGPAGCDDGNPCTTDACAAPGGCAYAAGCDDGDACTLDTCDATSGCKHATATCNGKPCAPNQCAAAACTGTWFNGRCWHANANATSWQAARSACEAQGRQLASVHSLAENQFVAGLVGPGKASIFIGLHSPSGDVSQYQWTDGTAGDFSLWGYGGLPSKAGPAYLQASGGYVWLATASPTVTFGAAYVCTGL